MAIATPEVFSQMLDRAKSGAFAYPAINVSSSQTLIAALRGFAEAQSDGIIQFSWGGAEYASGSTVKNMVDGAVALAEYAHIVAKNYNVNIALHTDHCPVEKLDGFMRPLLDIGAKRIKEGKAPLFNSHMWDGSAVSMPENMKIANPEASDLEIQRILSLLELNAISLDEVIGEFGRPLSGGEAKRVGVARALLSQAPICLLDEPTEHLDHNLAQRLETRITEECRNRSLIVITHSGWSKSTRTVTIERE